MPCVLEALWVKFKESRLQATPVIAFFLFLASGFISQVVSSNELGYFDVAEPFIANVGTDENYPNGFITSITQDSNGDIWFGTYDGVVRYDSHEFKSFKHDPQDPQTISGNLITHLSPDNNGGIWISSYSTGLTYLNNNQHILRQYTEQTETQPGLASNVVMATLLDEDKLWVATSKGLNQINLSDNAIRFFDYHLDKDAKKGGITSLAKDNTGRIWAGTTKGLMYLDKQTSLLTPVLTPSLKGKSVYRLYYSPQNQLWVGTQKHGIAYLDINTEQVNWLTSSQSEVADTAWVMGFSQISETQLWAATFGGGIIVVDLIKKQIIEHLIHHKDGKKGLISNDVSTLFMSNDQHLWIGHWGKYVQKINYQLPFVRTFDVASYGPFEADVNAITELTNNRLLIGNEQLIEVSTANQTLQITAIETVKKALNQDIITALAQAKDGSIWIGTRQSGLLQFDQQYRLLNHFNDSNDFPHQVIRYLVPSFDGGIWIGANALSKWRPEQGFTHYETKTQSESMLETDDGDLLLASFGKLYRVQPDTEQLQLVIENVSDTHPLAGNLITSLVKDKHNNIFFLSNSRLFKLIINKDGTANIELAPLYADYVIEGTRNIVIDDEQNIWTETEFINVATHTRSKFYRKDGIDIGTAWNGGMVVTKNKNIFFVGSRGLMVINPNIAAPQVLQKSTQITGLTLDGEPQMAKSAITIKPENSEITFELNAKNFSDPTIMEYQYTLSGYTNDWTSIPFKQRYITFRDLAPKQYNLTVRAINLDNNLPTLTSSQQLLVLPHWYETIWFKIGAILSALGIIWGGYSLRVNLVKKHNVELEKLVQARTKELAEKNIQIEKLANHDALTALPNLRLATDRLSEALKRSKRENNMTAVAYFDLDGFKLINDTYGHQAGDFILQSVANRVSNLIRETDTLCRIGGDEFLLIIESIEHRDLIEQLCQRILNEFSQSVDWEGHQLMIKMSIGVAVYPVHGLTGKALISHADKIMYEVKKAGKFNYKIGDF